MRQSWATWCDVTVVNGVRGVSLPQVHLMRDRDGAPALGVVAHSQESLERLFAFVNDKLATGTLRDMHVKIGPEDRCTTPRLTMHRDPPLTKQILGSRTSVHGQSDGVPAIVPNPPNTAETPAPKPGRCFGADCTRCESKSRPAWTRFD
jgi:hypothetical protein